MNRGTLMVMKRLFVTALAALGLGALVSGSAFGQTESNIPAPDGFNDQLGCAMNAAMIMLGTPAKKSGAGMSSTVDRLLRMDSTGRENTDPAHDAMGSVQQIGTDTVALIESVRAVSANCGAGTPFMDNDVAYNLANGYVALRTAWNEWVAAVEYRAGLNNPSDALKTAADNEVTAKKNALDALSMGPIYRAGVMEWDATRVVTSAATSWDEAVGVAAGGLQAIDESTGMGFLEAKQEYELASFSSYRHIEIDDSSFDRITGVYTGGMSGSGGDANFDGNGNFVWTASNQPGANSQTLGDIEADLTAANGLIKSIDQVISNTNALDTNKHANLRFSRAKAVPGT